MVLLYTYICICRKRWWWWWWWWWWYTHPVYLRIPIDAWCDSWKFLITFWNFASNNTTSRFVGRKPLFSRTSFWAFWSMLNFPGICFENGGLSTISSSELAVRFQFVLLRCFTAVGLFLFFLFLLLLLLLLLLWYRFPLCGWTWYVSSLKGYAPKQHPVRTALPYEVFWRMCNRLRGRTIGKKSMSGSQQEIHGWSLKAQFLSKTPNIYCTLPNYQRMDTKNPLERTFIFQTIM